MALLSEVQRRQVWRALMRRWSRDRTACGFTKDDLKAAIDDLDQWFDGNADVVNQALPQSFRSAATNAQKALLLNYITWKRWGRDPLPNEEA